MRTLCCFFFLLCYNFLLFTVLLVCSFPLPATEIRKKWASRTQRLFCELSGQSEREREREGGRERGGEGREESEESDSTEASGML